MRTIVVEITKTALELFDAVATGSGDDVWVCADRMRRTAWDASMPALASAAGALQDSLETGPQSECEIVISVYAIFSEVQRVIELERE